MKTDKACCLFMLIIHVLLLSAFCPKTGNCATLSGAITISGSSALMPLMREAAEIMREAHPGVEFSFQPAGSFIGHRQLASGSADVACSDVEIGEQYRYKQWQEVVFAIAPIYAITHPDVGIRSLSEEQISDVLTGKVRRWSDLGGSDLPIQLVRRLRFSGIRFAVDSFFPVGENSLNRDDILLAASESEVVLLVASTPGALGFAAGAAAGDARVIRLDLNGVAPTGENILSHAYPLFSKSRILFARNPSPQVAAFAQLISGERFAAHIKASGLLPMTGQTAAMQPIEETKPHRPVPNNSLEILGLALAGIGLFLTGVRFVAASMKKIANRRLRTMLARWTQNPLMAALWGMLCGAVSQSGTSSGFLLVSFVTSGLLTLRNAMFILSWSDVGTSLLVFLATANIKVVILYFLALSGAAYSFDKHRRYDAVLMACLGLGVLLFGCELIKSTAVQMTEMVWVQNLMSMAESSLFLLFLLGALLRVVTQSSSSVAILCIPLLKAGLLSLPQSAAMVCGTSLGAALAGSFLSGDLRGTGRQLILYKSMSDVLSGFFLFCLLVVKDGHGEALLMIGLKWAASTTAGSIAVMFLVAKLTTTAVSLLMGKPLRTLAALFSPVTPEEEMARLKYLHDHALESPEAAIELAELETGRILKRLPYYLDSIRQEEVEAEMGILRNSTVSANEQAAEQGGKTGMKSGVSKIEMDRMHNASMELGAEVSALLTEMVHLDVGYEGSERLLRIQNKHQAVMDLAIAVRDLVKYLQSSGNTQGLENLRFGMGEGLHIMLHLAAEANSSNEVNDYAILLQMTSDNGTLMENLRSSYLQDAQSVSSEARAGLLQLTNQYQRAVWLLHRWAEYNPSKLGNEAAKSVWENASATGAVV